MPGSYHPVSHNAVHKWVKKFEEKLPISTEKKQRNLIAIDETVVKANKKKYYVFSAIDIERNELILMRVYTTLFDSKVFHQRSLKISRKQAKICC